MFDFIINPNSRSGKGGQIWAELEEILKQTGTPYRVEYTECRGHAIALTEQVVARQKAEGVACPRVIVSGGDGTLNEVVTAFAGLEDRPILGYIPAGSGDDFTRGLHLTTSPQEALKQILNPSDLRLLDVGSVIYGEEKRRRRFVVSCGCGYDAAICHTINRSKLKYAFNKLHLSSLAYTVMGLIEVLRYKKVDATLICDGGEPMEFHDIAFISCHNLMYEGGGWPFAPGASADDGLLNISVYSAKHRLQLVRQLLASKSKSGKPPKGVKLITCSKATLRLSSPLIAHTDGEVLGRLKEFDFECLPAYLQLME